MVFALRIFTRILKYYSSSRFLFSVKEFRSFQWIKKKKKKSRKQKKRNENSSRKLKQIINISVVNKTLRARSTHRGE